MRACKMEALLQSVSPQGRAVLHDILSKLSLNALTQPNTPRAYTLLCAHTPEWLQKYIWPPQPEWDITETQAARFIELVHSTVKYVERTRALPPPEERRPSLEHTDYTGTVSVVFTV